MLPGRALLWEEEQILLVADTHFGKTDTFRRGGIPVPDGADKQGMNELASLIRETKARRCIILGDFFHSVINAGWISVKDWCLHQKKMGLPVELVPGNHDILNASDYLEAGILLHPPVLTIGTIRLQHEPPQEDGGNGYTFCGHLHPGVALTGKGRQRLRLPCYWFRDNVGVLPAFGHFTGLSDVRAGENDRIFVTTKTQRTVNEDGIIVPVKI